MGVIVLILTFNFLILNSLPDFYHINSILLLLPLYP